MAHGPRGGGHVVTPALDEISKRIIEAAVRQRVQRLQETGVMQIVAVTDPLMLGFRPQAMIGIRCDGDLQRLAGQLSTRASATSADSRAWSAAPTTARGGSPPAGRGPEVRCHRKRLTPAATGAAGRSGQGTS
jgi:DNA-binding Lrp family transcriptional regulator